MSSIIFLVREAWRDYDSHDERIVGAFTSEDEAKRICAEGEARLALARKINAEFVMLHALFREHMRVHNQAGWMYMKAKWAPLGQSLCRKHNIKFSGDDVPEKYHIGNGARNDSEYYYEQITLDPTTI